MFWLVVLTAVVAVTAVGCGSGGGGDSTGSEEVEETQPSQAKEPASVFAKRMARLLATAKAKRDCALLDAINKRSLTSFPCPSEKELRTSMADFEIVDSAEYGNGAVVDYKSGEVKDGAAILLFVAGDRSWAVSRFGVLTKPSTGTDDAADREGFDKAVDKYLKAVRERDCKAYANVAYLNLEEKGTACQRPFGRALRARLKANPSARVVYRGGNGTFGFYSLETQSPRPESSTISVVNITAKGAPAYLVLDVAPGPPPASTGSRTTALKP